MMASVAGLPLRHMHAWWNILSQVDAPAGGGGGGGRPVPHADFRRLLASSAAVLFGLDEGGWDPEPLINLTSLRVVVGEDGGHCCRGCVSVAGRTCARYARPPT